MDNSYDVIIPCYNEEEEALRLTLLSILFQSVPPQLIFIVDDFSPKPVTIPEGVPHEKIVLNRNSTNLGISLSRNSAIEKSTSKYIACINVEVLPDKDWAENTIRVLEERDRAVACYTRIVPQNRNVLNRYRMRFFEKKFPSQTQVSDWAPGHAVMFNSNAIKTIGGYNQQLKTIHEDFEICERLKGAGGQIYYCHESKCVSIQEDSLHNLAKKQLFRNGFSLIEEIDYEAAKRSLVGTCKNRMTRNMVKLRWLFLYYDIQLFFLSVSILNQKKHGKR